MSGTTQFLRAIQLTAGNSAGAVLDLSQLQVSFSVQAPDGRATLKQLDLRVFNPAPSTVSKMQAEFTSVTLSAGYQGNIGKIFSGQVKQYRYGRVDATTTYLDVIASDGDQAIANGFISQTLAAGWTANDVASEIAKATSSLEYPLTVATPPQPDQSSDAAYRLAAMQAALGGNITGGTLPALPPAAPQPQGIRPKVMFGPVRDHLRTLAVSTGTTFKIDDNALVFTAQAQVQQSLDTAIVLSPKTGLIGIPRQTINGIEATCLLNPRLKPGGLVKIDQSLIQAGAIGKAENYVNAYPTISTSGTYKIWWVEHEGDIRGEAWYSNLVCEATDGTTSISPDAVAKAGASGGLS